MRPRQLRARLALTAVGAIAAGTVLGTGVAKANPTDVAAYTRTYATVVCSVLDDYPSDGGVLGVMQGIQDDGFSGAEAAQVIVKSVSVWCPRNQPILNHFAGIEPTPSGSLVRA